MFTGVTERRMAQVMCETNGLHQVFIGAKRTGNRAANLGNLQGMRQTGPEIIPFKINKNLRLVFQPAESRGMKYAVAIALEGGTVIRFVIQISAAFRVHAADCIRRQTAIFYLFKILS